MVKLLGVFVLSFFTISVLAVEFIAQFKKEYQLNEFLQKYYKVNDRNITALDISHLNLGLRSFEIDEFKGVIGDFSIGLIKELYNDKNIISLSLDRNLSLAEVQENSPKHLTRLSQPQSLRKGQSLDYVYDPTGGIGVDVFILDTGVQASNPEFSSRVTKLADFTGEDERLIDRNDYIGHGTYIAGLVGSETYGVAKKANLFDVRITKKNGKAKLSAVIRALNLILSNSKITKRPSVVVIPLIMKKNAILNGAVEALIKTGIPVIVPAGNNGEQACNFSPASAKGALTVGAIDVDTDLISSFSNWGACVDIFAPGVKVETTSNSARGEKTIKSGTSLSTGITAGLVAYYMGMGDNGWQAVDRVVSYSLGDKIPKANLESKPLTANRIAFNRQGEPNWGVSP
ncbi:hypothetical protein WICMUC_002732 [Wickerhamomyces mucosus]|uniref:Peptidase S8/S53 domain-containing protein n=1 Tax=Wickerhamomyces mucosus TaxID=1378264 RepID=A0A9P8PNL4_9ASCO|nr:hypothetical protein WICMUC_002732 [Wickerhamomyces mucosus]